MRHVIFMAPVGSGVGLTTVCLGLVHALEKGGGDIKYLQPTSSDLTALERQLSRGEEEGIIDAIVARVEKLSLTGDVIVVQGIVAPEMASAADTLNTAIAKALDAEVILVTAVRGKPACEVEEQITICAQNYGGITHSRLLGYMVNKVGAPTDPGGTARIDLFDLPPQREEGEALGSLFFASSFTNLGSFPWKRDLMAPRVKDVALLVQGEILSPGLMATNRVSFFVLAAATVESFVQALRPNVLVIAPADRSDAILTTCLAYLEGRKIAGLLLTGEKPPSSETLKLCKQALDKGLPLLRVSTDSLRTAISLQNLTKKVPEDDEERRQKLRDHIAQRIDTSWIQKLLATETERGLSPPIFKYHILENARCANKRILLPEGEDPRIIAAAALCQEKKIARIVLLGDPQKIRAEAKRSGALLGKGVEIIDPQPLRAKYLKPLLELRKHKGLLKKEGEKLLQNAMALGTMMLALGEVDGLVGGAIHTTAETIRPALMLIKTKPDITKVSSLFFMCLKDRVLIYGDCAIQQNPTAEELAIIAIQCAASAERFGISPRVAMVSYSTGKSGAGEEVTKVLQATERARALRPDLAIDGPLQYDAAISPDVAAQKAPGSSVAGRATVYVFPDLNTANTTYKAVQRSADALCIGPMLQGLKKPVNDLSRGALVDDIVYTIALTAIQVEQTKTWE